MNRLAELLGWTKAVEVVEEILGLFPLDHPDRFVFFTKFAIIVKTRFEQQGDLIDLEKAIQLHEEALAQLPANH
jgi:hypothetical protein